MSGKEKRPYRKGKRDEIELHKIIAWRIGDEWRKNFPGFGGAKKCAEALGGSQSQLSHWEHGTRTPDDECLTKIAGAFGAVVLLNPQNSPDRLRKAGAGLSASNRRENNHGAKL